LARHIGIQGSVIGWDDPWHAAGCATMMRTGEGRHFPSQDKAPSAGTFLAWIRSLGADFYMHHAMPEDDEIARMIDDMAREGMRFVLANEYGNINGHVTPGTNRYDIREPLLARAADTGLFLGALYDETVHLQLHPDMYSRKWARSPDRPAHQWADPTGRTLDELEDAIAAAVAARRAQTNCVIYGEQVFPTLYHPLARGGMTPCPKLLKEEFQPLQLASAMGAAQQYGLGLGVCVDLWGMDVGAWFTRIWGFPGHSPAEYASALKLAWHTGAKLLFTENADALGRFDGERFCDSEFGLIHRSFAAEWAPAHPLPYDSRDVLADIVLIRSDDGIVTDRGNFGGRGPCGSAELATTREMASTFQAFHLLSHGTLPSNGSTWFLPQSTFPSGSFERTPESLAALPLARGAVSPYPHQHGLFYPLNALLVHDEKTELRGLDPKLIVLAGSRMTPACLAAVRRHLDRGAHCLAGRWLLPGDFPASDRLLAVDRFDCDAARAFVRPFIGRPDEWTIRFRQGSLTITPLDRLGESLGFRWQGA